MQLTKITGGTRAIATFASDDQSADEPEDAHPLDFLCCVRYIHYVADAHYLSPDGVP
jgi:hypothetical protein